MDFCASREYRHETVTVHVSLIMYSTKNPVRFVPVTRSKTKSKIFNTFTWGTAVAQWLRCCARNRKATGSISAGVVGIFH